MRTTISLPDPLLENAKQYAAEHRLSLSGLVEDALRRYMAPNHTAPPPPPFKLHTVKGTLVDPNLDLNRTSAVLAMLDDEEFLRKQR